MTFLALCAVLDARKSLWCQGCGPLEVDNLYDFRFAWPLLQFSWQWREAKETIRSKELTILTKNPWHQLTKSSPHLIHHPWAYNNQAPGAGTLEAKWRQYNPIFCLSLADLSSPKSSLKRIEAQRYGQVGRPSERL